MHGCDYCCHAKPATLSIVSTPLVENALGSYWTALGEPEKLTPPLPTAHTSQVQPTPWLMKSRRDTTSLAELLRTHNPTVATHSSSEIAEAMVKRRQRITGAF